MMTIAINKKNPFAKSGAFALNDSVAELTPSATLGINEAVNQKQARGENIIHLGFGQSSMPMHPLLLDAFSKAAPKTAYAPVLGLPALRSAVAAYLSRTRGLVCSAENIAVGPGSKPILYALLQILKGDLILARPSWVSYLPQARLAGKEVVWVETAPDNRHRITPQALTQAMEQGKMRKMNPRILLINSPSNPTGGMFDEFEVQAIALWARENEVTLISDEIYAEVAHGSKEHVSPARFYPEGCIVTGGMSKGFSAGGWRIGYASFPTNDFGRRVRDALNGLASEIWSAATTPAQEAAITAYGDDPSIDMYVRNCAVLHGYVVNKMHKLLTDMGTVCLRPDGGFYLYPDFCAWHENLGRYGVRSSPQLANWLIDKWNIASLPGTEFGDTPFNLTLRLSTSMLFDHLRASATEEDHRAVRRLLFDMELDPHTFEQEIAGRLIQFKTMNKAFDKFQQLFATLS